MKHNKTSTFALSAVAAAALLALSLPTQAGEGISDTQIIIGNSSPQSGPNAGYGTIGRAMRACFEYVNSELGGVKMGDGKTRKVKYLMYDDAMEPARSLQNARRLVSQDDAFMMMGAPGTGANLGARPFYNSEKVPQVLLYTGGPMLGDKENVEKFPWTMGGILAYNTEAAIYAKFIKENFPNAKIALFNDDSGGPFFAKAFVKVAKEMGLNIVIHEEHSYSEPTIDSKIDRLAASGADVFVDVTTPKFVVQGLKRMNAINWKPKHIIWGVGSSIGGALQPAGADVSKGVYSGIWLKDQADAKYANDADMKLYVEKLKKYESGVNPADGNAAAGWMFCNAVKQVLEQTKKPTRAAFMEQLRHLDKMKVPLLLDGITLTTNGAADGYPIESVQVAQYDGTKFVPIGGVVSYEGKTPAP